jgi:hypothetical protein
MSNNITTCLFPCLQCCPNGEAIESWHQTTAAAETSRAVDPEKPKSSVTSLFSHQPECTALELPNLAMSTSIASGLFKSLPKPKYTGEEEELPQHAQPRGPRVVGADQLDETQVVLRVSSERPLRCY